MARLWTKWWNLIYLQVSKGHLVQRLDEHYQGDCIERKLTMWPNAWKMVKELHFPNVEWFITEVAIKASDYGNQVMVTLDNEITVQFWDNDFNSIANTLLNFWHQSDLSKEVNISTYIDKEWYWKFALWQEWKLCQWFVTKENNQWCPQATKKTVAWKTQWNFDDVNDWYFRKLSDWISTYFPNGAISTPVEATSNISEKQKLADRWEQKDLHKDIDAPVQWYAKPMQSDDNKQVEQSTRWKTAEKNTTEDISIEDIPF